ncbi:translation initiation factor IF-2 N-terminal domain-containing protein [Levyella massiliensis]|uniref:translation initiation factor IF-2 N-terminal domain-containing protein n=1 Tax=Levyella massiliensis TaxID=938289 RepID=UPI0004AE5FE0|nr:translation initiation factor IF-2 N-terminal domain-containing protein [Levyella massiliensis]
MRVYELAKELGKQTTAFRELLEKELDLTFPSHMSALKESDVKLIREYFVEQTNKKSDKKETNKKEKQKVNKTEKHNSRHEEQEDNVGHKPHMDKKRKRNSMCRPIS